MTIFEFCYHVGLKVFERYALVSNQKIKAEREHSYHKIIKMMMMLLMMTLMVKKMMIVMISTVS